MNRAAVPAVASDIHLREYWKVVWHGRWTVVGCFLLVVGVTAVWSFLQTPIYRAAATVEVQPQANRIAAGRDVSGLGVAGYGWFAEEKYHNTQVEILTSRDVAKRVFDQLGLATHPEFEGLPDAVGAFRSRISAVPRRETGIIEISMTGPNPDEVMVWVDAVANAYVQRNIELADRNVARAMETIKAQLEKYRTDVSVSDAARFDALSGDSTAFASEDQVEIIKSRLRDYNAELNKKEIELSQTGQTLQRIRELEHGDSDVASIPELAEDAALRDLYQERVRLDLEMERAKVELRPGHQQYQRAENELAKVRQRIQERVATILDSVQQRHDITLQHVEYLHREIRAAEQESVDIARGKSKYDLKKTEADAKQQVFDMIQTTIDEVWPRGPPDVEQRLGARRTRRAPLYPIKPKRKLNVLLGGLFGLCLGVGAVFFLDYLDNTIRTPEDVERLPRTVRARRDPEDAARRAGGARGQGGLSVAAHERDLLEQEPPAARDPAHEHGTAGGQVVDHGQPGPHARRGRRSRDHRRRRPAPPDPAHDPWQGARPRPDELPGGTARRRAPGLGWSSYVRMGDPPNLHLLACGPIPPSPPELLGSDRFVELVAALRESYDWVLLDSPPAATLADATQLASVADMVILVVRQHHTDRDLVGKTLQRLRAVNPNVVGGVLNNVDIDAGLRARTTTTPARTTTNPTARRSARRASAARRARRSASPRESGAEVVERLAQAVRHGDARLPAQLAPRARDVGLADRGSSTGSGAVTIGDGLAGQVADRLGHPQHRPLLGVAEVHRLVQLGAQQATQARRRGRSTKQNERVWLPVAVHRERLPAQRLEQEVRDRAAVVEPHARAERVEDPRDLRVDAVHPVVGHRHRLGEALGLVVDAARADRIHVAPVALRLRMHERIAVHLGGRGQEEPRALGAWPRRAPCACRASRP